ncbi:protein of unknown function [Xenorhabdus bovienii]|uniref:Antitermination protein Q n=1 Tax=Xenorhabdus bovienii TaxID=40576 RepID=A0A0B6X8F3_XENBV|nr:protein of unknown function [Xenorhabdus bovienii]
MIFRWYLTNGVHGPVKGIVTLTGHLLQQGLKGWFPVPERLALNVVMMTVLRLKKYNPYYFQLIVMHYIKASALRAMGTKLGISHNEVSKRLQAAEGFIEGVLAVSGVTLELDKCVQKEIINRVA